MHRNAMTLSIAALLATLLQGCVTAPGVTETRAAICPRPMTSAELTRAADALDALPRGRDLDYIAAQLERLDDGARICRGR